LQNRTGYRQKPNDSKSHDEIDRPADAPPAEQSVS
jgi:hypothetical protein